MTNNGWRTVMVETGGKLLLENECLNIISETETKTIPINQIGILLIDEIRTEFSVRLIDKLVAENVKVIFCSEKHTPVCEIIPYYANSLITAGFKRQIKWDEQTKDIVWQNIVRAKIKAQSDLIKPLDETVYEKMILYYNAVEPGDKTNRESQAARIYFNTLFGNGFVRRTENDINSALNYGYAILLSTVNRFVAVHGYHTALGINHKSDDNPYNLSCDLMEPFRPVIDEFVFNNKERTLDFFYKREIIGTLYTEKIFSGKKTTVISAIEMYVEKILKILSSDNMKDNEEIYL